ncbi:hypothetical protein [Clostridium isatidis]|uniref:hypothetical protein n=1 Tax=Clostridium isatidis TaxID=182773 RepID=UPI003AAD4BDC
MSAFVLSREYELQLPTSYVDIDRAEMEYVDGGAWNSVQNIGYALDVLIWVGGVVTGVIGIVGSVREILRRNARGLVVQATSTLLRKVGLSAAGFLASSIVSGLELFLNLSLGQGIAMVLDRIDKVRYSGAIELW